MALPESTGVYRTSRDYSFGGPFLSDAKRIYVVGWSTTGGTSIGVSRSGTTGTTFTEYGTAWTPDSGQEILSIDAVQVGNVLHIACTTRAAESWYLHYRSFTMDTDTWGTSRSITSGTNWGADDPVCKRIKIAVRSGDGDIVIAFQGEPVKDMGKSYERVYIDWSDDGGATWAYTDVGSTSSQHMWPPSANRASCLGGMVACDNDRVHVIGNITPPGSTAARLCQQSIESGYTKGTNQTAVAVTEVWDGGADSWHEEQACEPIRYMDGATEKIAFTYRADDRDTWEAFATTGTAPTWTEQEISASDAYWGDTYIGADLDEMYGASLAYSSTSTDELEEITCLLPDHSSGDWYIVWRDADNTSGWGTTFNHRARTNSRRVRLQCFQRDGWNKVAMVYHEGGAVTTDLYYDEWNLNLVSSQSYLLPNRAQVPRLRM